MNMLLAVIAFIGAEVALFFLGVVPFSSSNWGVMLNQAVFSGGAMDSTAALAYLLSPLVCILLITVGLVLFLDAVDGLFNPRLRERSCPTPPRATEYRAPRRRPSRRSRSGI